jgi:hypothetical protein
MTTRGHLDTLVTAVRAAVARRTGWRETAQLVALELERHLPSPRILTAEQRAGDPQTFRSHVSTPSRTAASRSSRWSGAGDR